MRTRGRPRHPDILTPREWEVLSLIEQGASNEEISQRLGITERTAKYHVSEILSKLGVSSREEAVAALRDRTPESVNKGRWSTSWVWGAKVAAVAASMAALAGVAVLAWGVLQSSGNDELSADMSVDEVFTRMADAATRPNQVIHVAYETTTSGTTQDTQTIRGEYWIDPAGEAVRLGSGRYDSAITTSEGTYRVQGDRVVPELDNNGEDEVVTFCGEPSVLIGALVSCSWTGELTGQPAVKDEEWQGERMVALTGVFDVTTDLPEPSTRYEMTMTNYLDPETALPVAIRNKDVGLDTEWESLTVSTYEHDFVDRSSLPANFFDPQSLLELAD